MPITGLGPHGERAAPPSRVTLGDEDVAAARRRRFSAAVVLHTAESDWSKQQLAGLTGTLGGCGIVVSEVVDCRFEVDAQIAALDRLSRAPVDAIISIPVANAAVADAHRLVSGSGRKLVLLDNVPTGLLPGRDYASLVSADNFGLGLIAAELLAAEVGEGAEIALLTYGVDFYATNERDIAFSRWIRAHRPDLALRTVRFPSLEAVGETTRQLLRERPSLGGLFVVWDTPALAALTALEAEGRVMPVTTVDLGREAAIALASDGPLTGIAAQQPHEQGIAVAQAAVLAMLERPVPGWIALPGLAVTRANVAESYQRVWNTPAPPELLNSHAPH